MLNTIMHGITARQIKSLISESDNKLLGYATMLWGRGGGGGILQDWPLAFTARTILLPSGFYRLDNTSPSGFYFFLLISSTKTVVNNTSGY